MSSKQRLIFFIIFSFILHISAIIYLKPKLFLFSSFQNLKIQKKITKVKFFKIIEKPKPKTEIKEKKVKKEIKQQNTKQIKIKKKEKKIKKIQTKNKLKTKKTPIKQKKSNKIKKETLNYAIIQEKIKKIRLKEKIKEKKEIEKKIKKEKKKEAAYFYSKKLISLIQSLWIFPEVIKESDMPNLKIKIKLRVTKNGEIIGKPIILEESKNKLFNESALRAIEKLNNYRLPLPKIIDDKYIDIILTLTPPGYGE